MSKVANLVRSFVKDEEGATMVEYGIMVALIAAIVIVAVGPLGTQIASVFSNTTTAITPAG